MKIFSLSTLLTVSGAVAAGAFLFWTSLAVQQKEARLESLQDAVASEQQAIRVLNAEWDYLNRPDRLEVLAKDYLGLQQPAPAQNIAIDASNLPDPFVPVLPARKPLAGIQPASLQINASEGGE